MFAAVPMSALNALAPPDVRLFCLVRSHDFSHFVFGQAVFAPDDLKGNCVTPSHENDLLDVYVGQLFHRGSVPYIAFILIYCIV